VRSDYKLAKIELHKSHWHLILGIDHLEFNTQLPESIWHPPTDSGADVLRIEPTKIRQLFDFIGSRGV